MTKKLTKKLISIFLSLMMVLSLIPMGTMTAYAINSGDVCVCGHKAVEHYGTYYVNCNAVGCTGSLCSAGGFTYPEPINYTRQITLDGKDYLYDSKYVTNYGSSLYCDIHKELAHKYSEWEAPGGDGYSKCLEAGHIKEAGPPTCGLCVTCGHAKSEHGEYCEPCDMTNGPCNDESLYVACVLEKDHAGNHSETLPPCGVCVVCGHTESEHNPYFCETCDDKGVGNCRVAYNYAPCALDEGHDGNHSLGTVEAPEWADDIMGKIDIVAEFCVYNFYGGSFTLADLMQNKPLAELLADVSDEVLYRQDGNNYYIYGIDSTNVYMFKAEVNENGDITYLTFAQTKNSETEKVDFVPPIPGTPCGKCAICGHKQSEHIGTSCQTCYENDNISLSMHSYKACVLDSIHKGDHSDTLPPCGKCTGCGHPWTKHSSDRCSQCFEDMEGDCYIYISLSSGACVLPEGHDGACSAHTHNSSTYGYNETQHWTKCTDDDDNNGTAVNHTWSNGQCSVCNYTCQHTGGTATCTTQAVCSTCSASYGELAAHTYGTAGAEYYTCSKCLAEDADRKTAYETALASAKADAMAAIDAYVADSESEEAHILAENAKMEINSAETIEDVDAITQKALEDIKDIIAPDFKTLEKDLKFDGTEVKLTKDYTRVAGQSCVIIREGQKVVIDLNGHKLDGIEDEATFNDSIFVVEEGAELVINDSSDNEGVLTGGKGYYNYGNGYTYGGAILNFGTTTINGGTFTNNTASYGGVVYNDGTGTVTINDGVFVENEASVGGVVASYTQLTINGGVFDNNYASSQGGAVNNGRPGNALITGGTFTNNQSAYGGAVENYRANSLTIIGGTFTGNSATDNGGGIDNDQSSLYIGGSAVVKDNKVGEGTNNFEFESGSIALAETPFTEDADIGVTITAGTDTLIAEGATLDTLKALKSDDAEKMFIVEDGAVKLQNIADHVHSFGEAGADRYTCQTCGALDEDEKAAVDLADAKADAMDAIDSALGECEDADIVAIATAAKDAIDDAETIDDVEAIKNQGVADIANAIALAAAKVDAEKAIIDTVGDNHEKAVQETAAKYINAINSAASIDDVNKLKAEGIAAVKDAMHKHSYTSAVTTPATCTKDGVMTFTCSCGDAYTEVIKMTGHSYSSKVTKPATYTAAGVKTFTCDNCKDAYTVAIPRLKVTSDVKGANSTKLNAGLKVASSNKDVTVKWGKVADADGYIVYAAYCGKGYKAIKTVKGADAKSYSFTKLNGKKLNLNKNIKVYVVAYKTIDGKKVEFGKTIDAHVVGGWNRTYTNPTKVTVKNDKVALSVGKTATINATVAYKYPEKKAISDKHAAEKRYSSSNEAVATVDANGKIKAVGKGTCTVYVFAKNGNAAKVIVTVK